MVVMRVVRLAWQKVDNLVVLRELSWAALLVGMMVTAMAYLKVVVMDMKSVDLSEN